MYKSIQYDYVSFLLTKTPLMMYHRNVYIKFEIELSSLVDQLERNETHH